MMSFEKKAYQLGMMIDLTPKQIHEALDIYQKVSRDNNWDSVRNNYSLMIDCIYIVGKKYKVGITIDSIIYLTRELYGKSTQPKPHLWRQRYGV